ncbi:TPA: inverse autotransporter beta domain-containing protein [Morganella morganii]|nr:inverse autotransporter beta domain-containing protein [Morganella morganii]
MKLTIRDHISVRVRLLAWLNIGVQVIFPLAITFTPFVAGAGSDGRFLQDTAHTRLQTRSYTLGPGETAASVAASFNMTVDALRRLNQLRTFAHGFDNLQLGDELNVPLAPLPTVIWEDAPSAETDDDARAQAVTGYASRAGSFLASGPNGNAAASLARTMASSAAGNEVEQWLSRFGTARVKLDVDERFSLKNSQLDMLIPLYDHESDLLFTQGSLHRTDDRTQMNLGAGWRHFTDAQMTGANLFYDRDLSRGHARLGLGGEYWRDFLKLGANGYFRLSGWRDSPDVTDYEERPANGWDLRAQAWLPALPQLGGSLTFEQYYGKEVGLFGKDSRQRAPHAVTAGVNYTPFPLLTLSAEHRQGKQGKNDARLGIDLTWLLGVPWQQQVSPDAVASLRSLAGSRHDLVERNNNIVLEYRKKEVIRLKTVDLVTGFAGEQKSLGVSVNSKYGLKQIDWDAGALTAAGGSIVQGGNDWTVIFPAWRASGVNSYTVSGVAVDIQGNRSEPSTTQVTVLAPVISTENSTFTPAQSTLPADGKSTQVLTLTLKDAQGGSVSVPVDDVQFTPAQLNGATLSSPRLKKQGVYEVTVTAGMEAATLTVTPQVFGMTLSPSVVIMEDTLANAKQSVFTATPDSISADGVMASTLSLTLKNTAGELLTGQADRLSLAVSQDSAAARSLTGISIGDISEAEPGIYTATLSGTTEGRFRITPQFDKKALGELRATVILASVRPEISELKLAGRLEAGQTLSATYAFAANGGNTQDKSTYVWGYQNGTAAGVANGETVTASGQVPGRALTAADVGKVIELSVQARNGAGVTGNTATITSAGVITAVTELKDITVNGHTFAKNAGFPTTGFTGATFTLNIDNGSASDYTWDSDASWVSVRDGVVTFIREGSKRTVTITGTPANGSGKTLTYNFTLNSWYINGGSTLNNQFDANAYCRSHYYIVPTVAQMSLHSNHKPSKVRGIGALWNEWGNLDLYGVDFSGNYYWSKDKSGTEDGYIVDLKSGAAIRAWDKTGFFMVCRRDF